ncbi:glycosyltransferase family 4 protein [Pelagibius sp.]|uniref:glycosyltransferase family 4 protein n=1 Tax=Pelagibius sp. TaxID=1931238 RepID=UPI00262E34F4|nr:glycosyltransferase family 4 protein [Pelagibius sp.]
MSASHRSGRRSVIHVSSAHRVSDGRITRKEAASLLRVGYKVTILALKRAEGAELPADLEYIEYDLPSSRARRFLVRLPWLIWFCVRKRYDVYHVHDPELILLGLVLRLLGRRVVYDAHEAYAMVILDRDWIPRLVRPLFSRIWRSCEAFLANNASLTVIAHDTLEEQFEKARIVVVRNFPIPSDFHLSNSTAMADRPPVVTYHGDLTRQRGLFSMVEAMARLEGVADAELHLAGSLSEADEAELRRHDGAGRSKYLGWLSGAALAHELDQARAGLVLLHPTNNYLKIRPNKLYEYMAAGLPVIASDFPHWREVVEPCRCGILVDPLDAEEIAKAIRYLLDNPQEAAEMGRRGRMAVVELFNWQQEEDELIRAYSSMWSRA